MQIHRINIYIEAMHRITAIILDVINVLPNINVPIHKRFCVIPLPYYMGWFEISYPSITINKYYGQLFLKIMNGIHGTKLAGRYGN